MRHPGGIMRLIGIPSFAVVSDIPQSFVEERPLM
jgi:hypothetical protein